MGIKMNREKGVQMKGGRQAARFFEFANFGARGICCMKNNCGSSAIIEFYINHDNQF